VKRSTPPGLTSARWGIRTKRIIALILAVILAFALITFSSVLPLLIVASLLSYLLWPLVNLIEQRVLAFKPLRSRALAVLLTFVAVFTVFSFALVLIIPVLINQLADVGENLPQFLDDLETGVRDFLSQPVTFNANPVLIDGEPLIPLERLEALLGNGEVNGLFSGDQDFDLMQAISTFTGGLTGPAFSVVGGAITALFNLAFTFVIMFYLMRDGDRFIGHLVTITPRSYEGDVRRLLYELGRVWNAYLRGQLLLCVFIGVAVYIAALILGLPSAPVLGLIAGFLEFVPNIGPVLAAVPAILIALLSESSTFPFLSGLPFALVVAVVWAIIQQIESIYLVPRVMGGSLDLHPVVVIVAVIAGASTAGALGVILAAPFAATARVFGQYFYGKLFDTEPFPTPKPYEVQPQNSLIMRVYVSMQRRVRRRPTPTQLSLPDTTKEDG
jgi:predicted PurR-regulated permease PerM